MSQTERIPSRRGLLASGTAVLLTGAASVTTEHGAPVASAGDDAELLALCAEYHRQHDVGYSPTAEDWEDALEETWEISDQIAVIPATTEAGRRAKASVAWRLFTVENRGDRDCQFVQAVLRDLAGQGVGSEWRATA